MQQNQPQDLPGQQVGADASMNVTPMTVQGTLQQQAIAAAKELVLQHQQNPFRLSEELYRLKSHYLEQEFNITTGTADK